MGIFVYIIMIICCFVLIIVLIELYFCIIVVHGPAMLALCIIAFAHRDVCIVAQCPCCRYILTTLRVGAVAEASGAAGWRGLQ